MSEQDSGITSQESDNTTRSYSSAVVAPNPAVVFCQSIPPSSESSSGLFQTYSKPRRANDKTVRTESIETPTAAILGKLSNIRCLIAEAGTCVFANQGLPCSVDTATDQGGDR